MPLSVANIIQRNSGFFVGTTGTATVPTPTTAGNTVILFISQNAGLVTPAGFTFDTRATLTSPRGGIFRKSNVGAESSWTIAPSSTSICVWVVYEVSGLDLVNPLDTVQAGAMGTGTGATLSTGLTPVASTFDGLAFAMHAALDTTSVTPSTWSGHTGGLTENTDQGGFDATQSIGLSVSEAYSMSLAAWSCTATKTAPVGQGSLAGVVVYAAAGAKRAAQIVACTGYEFGTTAGLALPAGSGSPLFDASTGTPAIVTTSPRSGAYCLELSSVAAIENVLWDRIGSLTGVLGSQQCRRISLYFPTSLPGSDVVLFSLEPVTAGQAVIVRYKTATQKLSVQVGTGTEVASDTTVSANQWMSVDLRIDGRTTTHLCDWKVQYADGGSWVDQTQASMAAATIVSTGWSVRTGWTANTTATVRYDDDVVSPIGGHYPLGDYKVLPIKVDAAASLTLSGTSTNFNTFTANGTLAAWNATTAHNNIDEFPFVFGASADGFCQVATAGSDYVEIPMETIDASAAGAAIRGVRMEAAGWAASALSAGFGFHAWDGVTDLTMLGGATAVWADNSATPGWRCAMVKGASRQDWTQAKLDALAIRVGYSGDASPVIGIHGLIGEVALCIGPLIRIMETGDGFWVDARIDTDSSGYISFTVTTPPGIRGTTFGWTLSGTPNSIYVPANTVHLEYIGATDIAQLTDVSNYPDPE